MIASLPLHWLIMRVGFEIKGSILKSSVNRLNLFKGLIVSSASFLQECAISSLDSQPSFSSSPSVITSVGCSKNAETIYSTENARDWLVPSRKCTSRNFELNGSFFIRSFFLSHHCQVLCQIVYYFRRYGDRTCLNPPPLQAEIRLSNT